MRRLVGSLLVGLAGCLLVGALLSRYYIADRLVVIPLDQYGRTTAPGPGTYFDNASLTEKTGDLVAVRTLIGNPKVSTDDVAVWNVSLIISTSEGALFNGSVDHVAVDRRTAESVACCAESVDAEPVRHSGVTYKFPFSTGKHEYVFWDVTSRHGYPARYVSEEKLQGLTVYKFIQQIPEQQLRTQAGAGPLVGEAAGFAAPVWYGNTRTVWVEPKSGVIVKGTEQTRTTLRNAAGEDRVVVLDAVLTWNDTTQRAQAKLARDGARQIGLVRVWLPLLGLLLGLALLAVGVLLLRADRRSRPGPVPAAPTPHRGPDPATAGVDRV